MSEGREDPGITRMEWSGWSWSPRRRVPWLGVLLVVFGLAMLVDQLTPLSASALILGALAIAFGASWLIGGSRRAGGGAPRVQLLADEAQLLGGRGRRLGQAGGDLRPPGHGGLDLLQRGARMEEVEAHLARVVEVVDAQIGHDHGGPIAQPALLTPDAGRVIRAAQVAG